MKRAFTLAEILITLGVIGVIAAMTLPTVIENYQKQRTINQLKKVYTVLNQAFKMSEIDNDSYENWGNINEMNYTNYMNKYWKPYLKVIKVCSTYQTCGYSKQYPWVNANNTETVWRKIVGTSFILNDGTLITFWNNTQIMVDLNSYSKPNKYGRDLFVFSLSKKGVMAAGVYLDDFRYCCKTYQGPDSGEFCSGKIVHDGWKIKDDYPW